MTGSTTNLPADTTQLERDCPGPPAGSYRLRIDAVRSTSIQVDQPLAARFPVRGAFDYFTMFLQANTHYRIEVLLDALDDSVLALFDPAGREMASNNDFSDAHVRLPRPPQPTHYRIDGDRDLVGPTDLHCLKHRPHVIQTLYIQPPTASRPSTQSPAPPSAWPRPSVAQTLLFPGHLGLGIRLRVSRPGNLEPDPHPRQQCVHAARM